MTIHAKSISIASNLKRRTSSHSEHVVSVPGCEEHQKIDAEREEEFKMSVKRFGELAGKAALAGFALAVLTAAATPAKAALVTWDLWVKYDPVALAKAPVRYSGNGSQSWGAWATGHWVDSNSLGIDLDTVGTGSVTFNDAGCGAYECGPVEDDDFEISFEFEGATYQSGGSPTPVSFSTNDDHRYNGNSYVNEGQLGRGPAMKFYGPSVLGVDFNVQFGSWALSIEPGVVEIYDLTNQSNWPYWTVLRGTLCHNGFGEPGEDDACYRGEDTQMSTPIPAALPLFASGLVAMGLGAWRRRRNG